MSAVPAEKTVPVTGFLLAPRFLQAVGATQPGTDVAARGTRRVEGDHLPVWEALQGEALRAHAAFEYAARGAALAQHRGHRKRAETLTRLARKQHQRWVHASQIMSLYER